VLKYTRLENPDRDNNTLAYLSHFVSSDENEVL